jgi:hypothetical protein
MVVSNWGHILLYRVSVNILNALFKPHKSDFVEIIGITHNAQRMCRKCDSRDGCHTERTRQSYDIKFMLLVETNLTKRGKIA